MESYSPSFLGMVCALAGSLFLVLSALLPHVGKVLRGSKQCRKKRGAGRCRWEGAVKKAWLQREGGEE